MLDYEFRLKVVKWLLLASPQWWEKANWRTGSRILNFTLEASLPPIKTSSLSISYYCTLHVLSLGCCYAWTLLVANVCTTCKPLLRFGMKLMIILFMCWESKWNCKAWQQSLLRYSCRVGISSTCLEFLLGLEACLCKAYAMSKNWPLPVTNRFVYCVVPMTRLGFPPLPVLVHLCNSTAPEWQCEDCK